MIIESSDENLDCVLTFFATNHSHNQTMSEYDEHEVCTTVTEKIGYLGMIPIICGLGVCFNCIILCVFTKPAFRLQMTSSTLTYLTGLAIVDLLTALLILPIGFIRCIDTTSWHIQYAFNFYEKYIYRPFANIFMTSSVWTTLTITTERFIFLYNNGGEVSGQSMQRSVPTARIILILIYMLAICFSIPLFLYYDDISGDEVVGRSDFAKSVGYEVYSWIRMFIVKIVPIVSVAVLNVALVRLMRANSKNLKVMIFPMAIFARRVQAQNRMTIMLLSISTVFLFSHLLEPFIHASIFSTMFGECSIETPEYETFRMFGNLFETVSYASNFTAYCVFNPVFAMYVGQLFGCKPRKVEHKLDLKQSRNTSSHRVSKVIFSV